MPHGPPAAGDVAFPSSTSSRAHAAPHAPFAHPYPSSSPRRPPARAFAYDQPAASSMYEPQMPHQHTTAAPPPQLVYAPVRPRAFSELPGSGAPPTPVAPHPRQRTLDTYTAAYSPPRLYSTGSPVALHAPYARPAPPSPSSVEHLLPSPSQAAATPTAHNPHGHNYGGPARPAPPASSYSQPWNRSSSRSPHPRLRTSSSAATATTPPAPLPIILQERPGASGASSPQLSWSSQNIYALDQAAPVLGQTNERQSLPLTYPAPAQEPHRPSSAMGLVSHPTSAPMQEPSGSFSPYLPRPTPLPVVTSISTGAPISSSVAGGPASSSPALATASLGPHPSGSPRQGLTIETRYTSPQYPPRSPHYYGPKSSSSDDRVPGVNTFFGPMGTNASTPALVPHSLRPASPKRSSGSSVSGVPDLASGSAPPATKTKKGGMVDQFSMLFRRTRGQQAQTSSAQAQARAQVQAQAQVHAQARAQAKVYAYSQAQGQHAYEHPRPLPAHPATPNSSSHASSVASPTFARHPAPHQRNTSASTSNSAPSAGSRDSRIGSQGVSVSPGATYAASPSADERELYSSDEGPHHGPRESEELAITPARSSNSSLISPWGNSDGRATPNPTNPCLYERPASASAMNAYRNRPVSGSSERHTQRAKPRSRPGTAPSAPTTHPSCATIKPAPSTALAAPDGREHTKIQVTMNGNNFTVVDITAIPSAPDIKLRMMQALGIPESAFDQVTVRQTGLGIDALRSDPLNDNELMINCVGQGDADGSLKFFIAMDANDILERKARQEREVAERNRAGLQAAALPAHSAPPPPGVAAQANAHIAGSSGRPPKPWPAPPRQHPSSLLVGTSGVPPPPSGGTASVGRPSVAHLAQHAPLNRDESTRSTAGQTGHTPMYRPPYPLTTATSWTGQSTLSPDPTSPPSARPSAPRPATTNGVGRSPALGGTAVNELGEIVWPHPNLITDAGDHLMFQQRSTHDTNLHLEVGDTLQHLLKPQTNQRSPPMPSHPSASSSASSYPPPSARPTIEGPRGPTAPPPPPAPSVGYGPPPPSGVLSSPQTPKSKALHAEAGGRYHSPPPLPIEAKQNHTVPRNLPPTPTTTTTCPALPLAPAGSFTSSSTGSGPVTPAEPPRRLPFTPEWVPYSSSAHAPRPQMPMSTRPISGEAAVGSSISSASISDDSEFFHPVSGHSSISDRDSETKRISGPLSPVSPLSPESSMPSGRVRMSSNRPPAPPLPTPVAAPPPPPAPTSLPWLGEATGAPTSASSAPMVETGSGTVASDESTLTVGPNHILNILGGGAAARTPTASSPAAGQGEWKPPSATSPSTPLQGGDDDEGTTRIGSLLSPGSDEPTEAGTAEPEPAPAVPSQEDLISYPDADFLDSKEPMAHMADPRQGAERALLEKTSTETEERGCAKEDRSTSKLVPGRESPPLEVQAGEPAAVRPGAESPETDSNVISPSGEKNEDGFTVYPDDDLPGMDDPTVRLDDPRQDRLREAFKENSAAAMAQETDCGFTIYPDEDLPDVTEATVQVDGVPLLVPDKQPPEEASKSPSTTKSDEPEEGFWMKPDALEEEGRRLRHLIPTYEDPAPSPGKGLQRRRSTLRIDTRPDTISAVPGLAPITSADDEPSPAMGMTSSAGANNSPGAPEDELALDDWAMRPTQEALYDHLDEIFPEHDLDKPVIEPAAAESPTSVELPGDKVPSPAPAKSPSAAPTRKAAAPPSAWNDGGGMGTGAGTGSGALLRTRKSIRVVARDRMRDMDRANRAEANTGGAVLRRRSTRMWGARTREVRPGASMAEIQRSQRSGRGDKVTDVPTFVWAKGGLIGMGNYGRVYHAMNLTTGEMLAVKQVELPSTRSDQANTKRKNLVNALMSEIKTLNVLDHPNIVSYLGFEQANGFLSIFLEYVPGGSIGSCLRKHGKLEEPTVAYFTRQILDGLKYLHQNRLFHRDIKADNILVDYDGLCKISDFGTVRRSNDIYNNVEGMSLQGSIFWMAPEVAALTHKGYSAKADIWSLGCVVLEMFAGERPWSDQEVMQALISIGRSQLAPPVPEGVRMSKLSKDFLENCFAINPEDRPTAEKLLTHVFPHNIPQGWTFQQSKLYRAIANKPARASTRRRFPRGESALKGSSSNQLEVPSVSTAPRPDNGD